MPEKSRNNIEKIPCQFLDEFIFFSHLFFVKSELVVCLKRCFVIKDYQVKVLS